MTLICMVRHGETNQNKLKKIQGRCDFPLNDNGIKQANLIGEYINNNYQFDIIISSPLSRAVETANIIKNNCNIKELYIDDDFIERSFGVAEGLDICDEVFNHVLNDDYEGLETSKDIQNRVYKAFLKISNIYKDKRILIVTHSHTIKAILTYLDKSRTFMDRLDNCSLNFFEIKDKKIEIKEVNVYPLK